VTVGRLQGQWKLVSVDEDGKKVADVEMFSCFLFGNKLAVKDKKSEACISSGSTRP